MFLSKTVWMIPDGSIKNELWCVYNEKLKCTDDEAMEDEATKTIRCSMVYFIVFCCIELHSIVTSNDISTLTPSPSARTCHHQLDEQIRFRQ